MSATIGSRIKSMRTSRNITLQELGEASGLSASYLSQVERGVCAISISSLRKVAAALKINMDAFIAVKPEDNFDLHLNQHAYVCPPHAPYYYALLSNDNQDKHLECEYVTLLPGRPDNGFPLAVGSFLYMLSGRLDVELDGVQEQMYHGDSLYYDPKMSLRCWNRSQGPVTFIYATYRA